MKKFYFWSVIALAALSMTSCSQDETLEARPQENAIEFGTYLGRDVQTRAHVVDNNALKTEGFGVLAFYTGTSDWDSWTGSKTAPNFMNNTKVTYNAGADAWEYSPVKYWPNNEGDKVSFFAYAPHNSTSPINTTVDASIDFTVENDVKDQIDLIWNYTNFLNQTKQAIDGKINFRFAHALARIGFKVAAATDEVDLGSNKLDANTKIELKKVVLAGDKYVEGGPNTGVFYTNGRLNLNNTDPNAAIWSNRTGAQLFELTTANFVGTNVIELNSGNSNDYQPVNAADSYIMVIPQSLSKLYVYVEYDVITTSIGDTDNSTITNKINTLISTPIDFVNGKAYSLKLLLGMTSVKVHAEVDAWPAEGETEVDLPENF